MIWLIRDRLTGRLLAVRGTYAIACRAGRPALNGCVSPYSGMVGR